MLTIAEMANKYKISYVAVRQWVSRGCPYENEKVIGRKSRIVLDEKKVEEWLNLTKKKVK